MIDLKNELKTAMLEKNSIKVGVIRMIISEINNAKVAKGSIHDDISEDDTLTVIKKMSNQRKESIEAFTKGGNLEQANNEKKELEILEAYLPAQLSEQEIENIVKQTAKEIGAITKADMGNLMKAIMPKVKNKADGGIVKTIVEKVLS